MMNDEEQAAFEQGIIHKVMSERGKKGGEATLKKHGLKHFEKIGAKGAITIKKKWKLNPPPPRSSNPKSPK